MPTPWWIKARDKEKKTELLPSVFKQEEEGKEKSKHNVCSTWFDSIVYRIQQIQNWANGHSFLCGKAASSQLWKFSKCLEARRKAFQPERTASRAGPTTTCLESTVVSQAWGVRVEAARKSCPRSTLPWIRANEKRQDVGERGQRNLI